MSHERDLIYQSSEEGISTADERELRPDLKPWVTPVVSESPVNELTAASFTLGGQDAGIYS